VRQAAHAGRRTPRGSPATPRCRRGACGSAYPPRLACDASVSATTSAGSSTAVSRTASSGDATPFLPARKNLKALREAAAGCRGCHLYERATQTVFSDGRRSARLMMVGEIPGDREDREGRVFVGPAGRELDKALEAVDIARRDVYITNVVKHFKFEERGKRRIHQKPSKREVDACLPWLRAELDVVKPSALLLLGATASKALLGQGFKLTEHRGEPLDSELAELVVATIHPSAILRARDEASRQAQRESFIADLRVVAERMA
jgi:uracil-DNA glycosylase